MKERGMIFNAEMVRALLNGRKTQTRRPLNLNNHAGWRVEQNEYGTALLGRITCPHPKKGQFGVFIQKNSVNGRIETDLIPCPFGQVGDRIWVREAFRVDLLGGHGYRGEEGYERWEHLSVEFMQGGQELDFYFLNGIPVEGTPVNADYEMAFRMADSGPEDGYRPSIHMPRWASRITLEITEVRVERLQDISEEDAECEGVETASPQEATGAHYSPAYQHLWDSLYGNWSDNPWVWVIEFKVIEK